MQIILVQLVDPNSWSPSCYRESMSIHYILLCADHALKRCFIAVHAGAAVGLADTKRSMSSSGIRLMSTLFQ